MAQSYIALMAPNREIAPSTPSGPRRRPQGGSLRDRFRDSIRDALSGVDVEELQGQTPASSPRGGGDVPPVIRPTVTGLEAELQALRAERAELERRAAARGSRAAAAAAVEVVASPEDTPVGDASAVPWSPQRAMLPVPASGGLVPPAAPAPPARAPIPPDAVARVPRPPAAVPKPRRSARPAAAAAHPVRDTGLESVVAPLLAEVASLRAEVEHLRGPSAGTGAPRGRQLLKLVIGVLVGFALIVIALAVVLKA